LNGNGLKSLEIYNSILIPNQQTYSIILNACSHSLLVNQAQKIFNSIPNQYRNVFIYATMVNRFFFNIKIFNYLLNRLMHYVEHRKLIKLKFYFLNMNRLIKNIHQCILHY